MLWLLEPNFDQLGWKAYKIGEKSIQNLIWKADQAYHVIDNYPYTQYTYMLTIAMISTGAGCLGLSLLQPSTNAGISSMVMLKSYTVFPSLNVQFCSPFILVSMRNSGRFLWFHFWYDNNALIEVSVEFPSFSYIFNTVTMYKMHNIQAAAVILNWDMLTRELQLLQMMALPLIIYCLHAQLVN